MITAVASENNKTGITKLSEKMNFEQNVEIDDSHISLFVFLFSPSSEICIPTESESASAIAITRIPLITTIFEFVLEYNPMINPSVVIIPEVRPKLKPLFIDFFTI